MMRMHILESKERSMISAGTQDSGAESGEEEGDALCANNLPGGVHHSLRVLLREGLHARLDHVDRSGDPVRAGRADPSCGEEAPVNRSLVLTAPALQYRLKYTLKNTVSRGLHTHSDVERFGGEESIKGLCAGCGCEQSEQKNGGNHVSLCTNVCLLFPKADKLYPILRSNNE